MSEIKVVCHSCNVHVFDFVGDYPQVGELMVASQLKPVSSQVPQPHDFMEVKCPFCNALGVEFLAYPDSFQRVESVAMPVVIEFGRIFKFLEVATR